MKVVELLQTTYSTFSKVKTQPCEKDILSSMVYPARMRENYNEDVSNGESRDMGDNETCLK